MVAACPKMQNELVSALYETKADGKLTSDQISEMDNGIRLLNGPHSSTREIGLLVLRRLAAKIVNSNR